MVQVVKMTDEEKFEMYMKVSHEELVRMKIESERLNDIWNEPKYYFTQSQFNLIPEEVELVKVICQCYYDMILEEYCSQKDIDCSEDKEAFYLCENLLTRIKQWQDENN